MWAIHPNTRYANAYTTKILFIERLPFTLSLITIFSGGK